MTIRERQALVLLDERDGPCSLDDLTRDAERRWGHRRPIFARALSKLVAIGWAERTERKSGELLYAITNRGRMAIGRAPRG